MQKKVLGIELVVFLLTLLIGMGVASINKVAFAGTMDFSVEANIPGDQIDQSLTYFDLRMSPGAKQTVSLTVQNYSTEEITITIEPNTAITNQNGVIDYSSNNHEKDSSLKLEAGTYHNCYRWRSKLGVR